MKITIAVLIVSQSWPCHTRGQSSFVNTMSKVTELYQVYMMVVEGGALQPGSSPHLFGRLLPFYKHIPCISCMPSLEYK